MRISSLYLILMALPLFFLGTMSYFSEIAGPTTPYFIFGGILTLIVILIESFSWYLDWREDRKNLEDINKLKEEFLLFKQDESQQISFLVKLIQGKEKISNFDQDRFSREFYQQSETILVHNNLKRRKARDFINFLTPETLLQIIPRDQVLILALKLKIYQFSNSTLNSYLGEIEPVFMTLGAIPSKVHELPYFFLKKFLKCDLINLIKQQEWNFFLKEGKTIEQYLKDKEEKNELKNPTE